MSRCPFSPFIGHHTFTSLKYSDSEIQTSSLNELDHSLKFLMQIMSSNGVNPLSQLQRLETNKLTVLKQPAQFASSATTATTAAATTTTTTATTTTMATNSNKTRFPHSQLPKLAMPLASQLKLVSSLFRTL